VETETSARRAISSRVTVTVLFPLRRVKANVCLYHYHTSKRLLCQ
jgi:hypothetical protein